MKKKIVVIGGGFGGFYFAKKVKSSDFEITLIDRRNHHLFQPLLYQVATGGLSPGDIAYPIRSALSSKKNIRFVQDEVIDFCAADKSVITKNGKYNYDMLIVAAGTGNSYFGNDSWEKNAPGLKSIEDALKMRSKILYPLEKAEIESDSEKQRSLMTYVVIGGGPTGVELCGAIAEMTKVTLRGTFRSIQSEQTRIVLVEAGKRILAGFSEKLSQKALVNLKKLGVEVLLNTKVTQIESDFVEIENDGKREKIGTESVLWGAGVKTSDLVLRLKEQFNCIVDKQGRVQVNPTLQIELEHAVFVIGDIAHVIDPQTTKPLAGIAPVAMQQGAYLAKNVHKFMKGESTKPFMYWDRGSLAVIGRNKAVGTVFGYELSGFPAWFTWVFIHIAYLIGFSNRIIVLFQWAWNYITRKRGALLITD